MRRNDPFPTLQLVELALASNLVIGARITRFMFASWPLSPTDQREWLRMSAEKVEAFAESGFALARAGTRLQRDLFGLWNAGSCAASLRAAQTAAATGAGVMGAALAPYHRRSRANARRLSR